MAIKQARKPSDLKYGKYVNPHPFPPGEPENEEKKDKSKNRKFYLDYQSIMLYYEDPELFHRFKEGDSSINIPISSGDILNKFLTTCIISEEKIKEQFVIVDSIPESSTIRNYLKDLADEIRSASFDGEISEVTVDEIREKLHKKIDSKLSIEELKQEQVLHSEYFRYLYNRDTMYMITVEEYDTMMSISKNIIMEHDTIKMLQSSPKSLELIESGIICDNTRTHNYDFKGYIRLMYEPNAIMLGSKTDAIIFKYTENSIYRFPEEFKKSNYAQEAAHANIVLTSLGYSNIRYTILAYDKYGRARWYNITPGTLDKAVKEYESILYAIYSNISAGIQDIPYFAQGTAYNSL